MWHSCVHTALTHTHHVHDRGDLKGAQKELERIEELGGLPRVFLAQVLHLRKVTDRPVDVPDELKSILEKVLSK